MNVFDRNLICRSIGLLACGVICGVSMRALLGAGDTPLYATWTKVLALASLVLGSLLPGEIATKTVAGIAVGSVTPRIIADLIDVISDIRSHNLWPIEIGGEFIVCCIPLATGLTVGCLARFLTTRLATKMRGR